MIAEPNTMDPQLQALANYTIFHIGLYATLTSALIALLKFVDLSGFKPYLAACLFCFLIAGAAGGLVGAGIPYATDFDDFMGSSVGPWRMEWISVRLCTHVEHTAFWIGITIAAIGAVRIGPKKGEAV